MIREREQIFHAWYDYNHALDEDEKASAKIKRDQLIRRAFEERGFPPDISGFLHTYRDAFREYSIGLNGRQTRTPF